MMKISPKTVLRLISYWPPYFFAGVKVLSFADDLSWVRVGMKTRFWNQNYFGTHFGGSLFSMCDPFYVFMLADKLKEEHIIWDYDGYIKYLKAVREPVEVCFKIDSQQVEKIKQEVLQSFNTKPVFTAVIETKSGERVAEIKKTLYVRRKDAKKRFQTS